MKKKLNRGFTLIELLVVIAIIGLLSTVVLASLNTARMRAKDSQRVQQLQQLVNALELYALDNNGIYPSPTASDGGACSSCVSALANYLTPATGKKYMPALPVDSKWGDTSNGFRYQRCDDMKSFTILTGHETGTNVGTNVNGPTGGVGGWCHLRNSTTPNYGDGNPSCWMTSTNQATYGWCDQEM